MSALRESLTKFPYLQEPIHEDGFLKWTSLHHYRTSYNDMQVSVFLMSVILKRHQFVTREV